MAKDQKSKQDTTRSTTWANFLLILGAILLPLSLITLWLYYTLLTPEGFLAAIGPLSKNEAVAADLSAVVSQRLFTLANVEERISNAFPEQGAFLAVPLTQELQSFVTEKAKQVILTDEFNNTWIEINRAIYPQIVNLLLGKDQFEALSATEGKVILDLQPIGDRLKTRLSQEGITFLNNVSLPEENRQYVLFESERLARIQRVFTIFSQLAIILPFLTLASLTGAFFLHPERVRSGYLIGIIIMFGSAVVGITMLLGRSYFLSNTPNLSDAASMAFFDSFTQPLNTTVIIAFLLGLGITFLFRFKATKTSNPHG